MVKLSFTEYAPRYVGAPIDEFMQTAGVLQHRFNKARQQDMMLQSLVDNLPSSKLEGDKAYAKYHIDQTQAMIDERAKRGDYENMEFETMQNAVKFQQVAQNLAKNKAAVKQYQQELEEGYKEGTYDFETMQNAQKLSMKMNKGLEFDPETGRVTGGWFSGYEPAKYVDIQKRLDELFDGWKAEGRISGPTQSGNIWYSTKNKFVSEAELYQLGVNELMKNPDATAYLRQSAMFKTMDMDDQQAQAILDKEGITAKELGMTDQEWNALTPIERYQSSIMQDQVTSAARLMASKHGFVDQEMDWKFDPAWVAMEKNRAKFMSETGLGLTAAMQSSLPGLPEMMENQKKYNNAAVESRQIFEEFANKAGLDYLYNEDGSIKKDAFGNPMYEMGNSLKTNDALNRAYMNYMDANETAAQSKASMDSFFKNIGVDLTNDIQSIIKEQYGENYGNALNRMFDNRAFGVQGELSNEVYSRAVAMKLGLDPDEVNAGYLGHVINASKFNDDGTGEVTLQFGVEKGILSEEEKEGDNLTLLSGTWLGELSDALIKRIDDFERGVSKNIRARTITLSSDDIYKAINSDNKLKLKVASEIPGVKEGIQRFNEKRASHRSNVVLRSMDKKVRKQIEDSFKPLLMESLSASDKGMRIYQAWDFDTNEEIIDPDDMEPGKFELNNWFWNPQKGRFQLLWHSTVPTGEDKEQVRQRIYTDAPIGFEQELYRSGVITHQQTQIATQVSSLYQKPGNSGMIGYNEINGTPIDHGQINLKMLTPDEQASLPGKGYGGQMHKPLFQATFPYEDAETGKAHKMTKDFVSSDEVVQWYLNNYLPLVTSQIQQQ